MNPFTLPGIAGQVEGLNTQFQQDAASGSIIVEAHYENGVLKKAIVDARVVLRVPGIDNGARKGPQ